MFDADVSVFTLQPTCRKLKIANITTLWTYLLTNECDLLFEVDSFASEINSTVTYWCAIYNNESDIITLGKQLTTYRNLGK
jgi:hypothetical protein